MSTFQERVKLVIGDGGYDFSMRRSLQTVLLLEAKRCLEPMYSTLRPFQRRAVFMDAAHALLDSFDFIYAHQKETIFWRTATSKEHLEADLAWRKVKPIEIELEKIRQRLIPFLSNNKATTTTTTIKSDAADDCSDSDGTSNSNTNTNAKDPFEAMVQDMYESLNETNRGKRRPTHWEHSHNHVLMSYRLYYGNASITLDPTFPPPHLPVQIEVPNERTISIYSSSSSSKRNCSNTGGVKKTIIQPPPPPPPLTTCTTANNDNINNATNSGATENGRGIGRTSISTTTSAVAAAASAPLRQQHIVQQHQQQQHKGSTTTISVDSAPAPGEDLEVPDILEDETTTETKKNNNNNNNNRTTTQQQHPAVVTVMGEDRRTILQEVREHLELLKEFEGVISPEDIAKRKRDLFLALPPAPPPAVATCSTTAAATSATITANSIINNPPKKKAKLT